ncbi:MAG TPA: TIR-like protein FxsC [Thermoanaerobaculia bacterium]|nr:TIR-like protein FxsC [Thermoanaerobaculia bacterium]
MPYSFFFSYARIDRDPYLKKFFDQLAENVRMQVGGPLEEVGFFDTDTIQLGQEWPGRLAEALRTVRVFVPIFTPSYFSSEFCGKEWTVFEERRKVLSSGSVPVILPVLWVPENKLPATLPQAVANLQYKHEDFGELYAQEGLWQLMRISKHRNRRLEIIDRLAERIIEGGKKPPPTMPGLPPPQEVQSAFHVRPGVPEAAAPAASNVGPRYVQFIFVAGKRDEFELQNLRQRLECYGTEGGLDWQPYLPEQKEEIAIVAQGVAASEKLRYQEVPLDSDLIAHLEKALKDNKIVAIIVDTWTLRLEQYHELMRVYDQRSFANSVVIIPWNLNDEETKQTEATLRRAIEGTFQNRCLSKDPHSFFDAVQSPEDLRTSLSKALNTARTRIFSLAEVKKRLVTENVIARTFLQN